MILALDVGTRRIGVAGSDPGENFALPLRVFQRTNLRADIDRIVAIADEYGAQELVVGDPVALSGRRGIASDKMDRFVEGLQRRFSGQIHRVDERMTTVQATRTLLSADVSRARRKAVVDKLAAALILETFLAKRKRQSAV
ncbi:MAG: Holliday junction resolvase RuvX [Candidatus Meridianibacter frigidus]|nr:MAG: Holliday junction resolvase RuvX [Candidatus Eremiobacteraeota bacterium]